MSLLQYIVSGGLHEIIPVISEQFLVNKPLLSKSILLALNIVFANRLGKKKRGLTDKKGLLSPEVVLRSELRNVGWIAG